MLVCGEREAMVMALPAMCDSAVSPCFLGCPAFLHRHFPPQSPPLYSLDLSLHSQQQPLPWDSSTIPKLQLPATLPSRGPASLSGVCMALARTVWFLFHLGCHTLSLKWFSSDSDDCFDVGIRPLLQFTHWLRAGPVLLTLLLFPLVLSSYRVLRGSVYSVYSFPLVLSTLSWCSACTSVSEGVFLMYLWREIYSMSTYSSAILFLPIFFKSRGKKSSAQQRKPSIKWKDNLWNGRIYL